MSRPEIRRWFGVWLPALVVCLLIVPASALAADGADLSTLSALFVQILIAAGIAVQSKVLSELRARISAPPPRAPGGALAPLQSAAWRLDTAPEARIIRLEAQVAELTQANAELNAKIGSIQADTTEILRFLTGGTHGA